MSDLRSISDEDLDDSDVSAAERCRRLFIDWAREAQIEMVRWSSKLAGLTESLVDEFASLEFDELSRIMPLIREDYSADPDWDPGTPDEFAALMLRKVVVDPLVAYRTRGFLGPSWKSYSRLSQTVQGEFEGRIMRMAVVSRARLSFKIAAFNEKFDSRPLPKTKEESDALMADMFSEILGRRVEAES